MNLKFLITRSIFENSNITQRDLSNEYKVSLGKINSVIKELVEEGFISQSQYVKEKFNEEKNKSLYTVTEKGKTNLKKHTVDGALILACGMGVRLAPLTYDTPKCFIKIKGERMIERQIRQLKEANINDITIMVGFMKEKFDYLIDKYNVKLLYNEEYKYKNTLSTFYHAKEIIRGKNYYICVSDVYIEKNIYHEFEIEPYYIGAFYEDCRDEWRYVVNSKSEVKELAVGGKNDYCLVGPAFLTSDYLKVFIPKIEDYYSRTSTDNYYWEDVMRNELKTLPPIYLYKLDKGIIFEFDTLQDLKNYDKESTEFGSGAISFVSNAFHIKDNEIENIICVKEGMTNKSYRFTFNNVEYYARVPGENTEVFIDRKAEGEMINALKGKNISEEVVYFDDVKGYKISKAFINSRVINIENVNELQNAMALYRRFHTLDIKVSKSNSIIDMIREYLQIIKNKNIVVLYEDFYEVVDKIKKVEEYIQGEVRPRTVCHGDPNPGNVLITSDGYKIIDFEYAGMGDPISDIALFAAYVLYDEEKTFKLYEMYRDSMDKDEIGIIPKSDVAAKKLLYSYMALSGFYAAIWAVVRDAMSYTDNSNYGMNGYRLCKNYLKLVDKY